MATHLAVVDIPARILLGAAMTLKEWESVDKPQAALRKVGQVVKWATQGRLLELFRSLLPRKQVKGRITRTSRAAQHLGVAFSNEIIIGN